MNLLAQASGFFYMRKTTKKSSVKTLKRLNARHIAFCEEYVVDRNGAAAAVRAGFSERSARSIAHELLKDPLIIEKVEKLTAKLSEITLVSAADVINELARLSFFNIKNLYKDDKLKTVTELDDNTAAAISGIKIRTVGDAGDTEIDYRIYDKIAALDKLARHLGLYEKDNTQQNQGLADALNDAIRRVESK